MASRQIFHGALLAAAILAGALALKWAQHHQYVSGDLAERGFEVIIGLGFAAYANFIPKTVPGLKLSPDRAARVQGAQRLNSLLFFLAGLAFAAIWAFAPKALAAPASMAVMGGAVAVAAGNLGYCVMSITRKDANPAH
jgi:hypothetical protein